MRVPSSGQRWSLPESGTDDLCWQVELFSVLVAAVVLSLQFYSDVSVKRDWNGRARKHVVLLVGKAFSKTTLELTQKRHLIQNVRCSDRWVVGNRVSSRGATKSLPATWRVNLTCRFR